ncbi:hypothetical protein BJX63DRAFT_395323 [Aspergillus granulosus]|uniref:Glucose-methanol-choline oxidoreductase N-terminal domain-containing protein n=1 Tax=Aspergillus granulosus TaxID=176169 RepID=A0ABR4HBV6_9EURO
MAFKLVASVVLCLLAVPTRSAPIGSSYGIPGDAVYDYVIVGAGNAGAPVAHRLAEAGHTVALVEAGSLYEIGNGNFSQVPANALFFMGKDPNDTNGHVDWNFVTTPQAEWNNATVHYASGKALGGGTARNVMTYHLPTEGSMEKWADQVGDDSWGWDSILQYIMRSQRFTLPNQDLRFANSTPEYDIATLERSGLVDISFPNYANGFASWVVRGFQELSLSAIRGFTSGELLGWSYILNTINPNDGLRASAKTAYLDPLVGRNLNLIIYQSTHAKQILFTDNTTASGVRVNSEGQEYTLSARNEVIVSAGAFKTPQLLMVSGIGPAANLERHNIPIVADLPGVGQNLQDHTLAGPSYRVNVITGSSNSIPSYLVQAQSQFNSRPPQGPLTNPGIDVLAWEKIPDELRENFTVEAQEALAAFPTDWPEVEYMPVYGYFGDQSNYAHGPNDGYNYAAIVAALVAPLSRGTVDIASTDTEDSPIIDPRWFSNPGDLEVGIAAFRRSRELMATRSVSQVVIGEEQYPGLDVQTDEEIIEFLRNASNTVHHACCTAAMGRSDDPNAVVDIDGRVFGVSNLRIVDASIMPFLTPGHPISILYGLAEKIAESIIADAE